MEWRQSLHPYYEVSECGDMRLLVSRSNRVAGTVLRGRINRGYREYKLNLGNHAKTYPAHRLVLFAFNGPPPTPEHQCAHWDGDPLNNHYTNLRWATAAENTADKVRHGNIYNGNRKMTKEQVLAIRAMREAGATYDTIRAEYPMTKSNLSSIINRQTWSHI